MNSVGNTWAVSMWLKPDVVIGQAGAGVPWWLVEGTNYRGYVYVVGNNLNVYIGDGTNDIRGDYQNVFMKNNKWYHILMSYDGPKDELDVYVNGELLSGTLQKTGSNINVSSTGFCIGRYGIGGAVNAPVYNGIIDNVRVYSEPIKR